MKNNKAQLKMGETIFVLVIFFILLAMGLIFYANFERDSIHKINRIEQQRRIMETVLSITYFPELMCSDLEGNLREGCFDKLKVKAFSELMNSQDMAVRDRMKETYYDFFGDSIITLVQVYPVQVPVQEFLIFNRTITGFQSIKTSFIAVSLRDPFKQENAFGYLKIQTFE